MKIKEQAQELASLLGVNSPSQPIVSTNNDIVDDTPEELTPEPVFEFNYEKMKKFYFKKAKESIKKIVRVVIRDDELIDKSFIADKIDQDAEQLAQLYYQQRKTEVMQEANMESVRTGNVSPRMFETFNQLGNSLTAIAKQISEFQISIKDNYAKIKFDSLDESPYPPLLGSGDNLPKEIQVGNVFKNGKEINLSILEMKKQKMIEMKKSKEVNYEEV